LQHISKPFEGLNSISWQANEISEMIRTQAQKWTPILVCSTDDRKAVADTVSDDIIMGAV